MAGIPLFDPEKMFELPQCPICIERLEEPVEGLNLTATILCNHTFHANCLVPWDDNSCPTCRCISTPVSELENTLDNNLTRSYADISKKSPQKVVDSRIRCHQCERERKLKRQRNQKSKSKNDNNDIVQLNESKSELTLAEEFDQLRPKSLQICLICGHIGCNFYEEKHAEKHYQETGHTYAMDLADGTKVWDYASQKFVHRLLTAYDESAGDNSTAKIVEIDPIMPVCHDDSSCSPNRNNTNNNHHFSLNDFHQHDEKGNCSLYASTSRCREQRRQNNIRPLDWAMEDDNEKITFHELKNNPSKEDKYCKLDQAQDAQISLIQIQCVKLLSHQLEQQRVYWQNRLKEVELKRLEDRETLEVLYEKEMSENFQTVGGDRNQTNMDNGDRRTAFQETENMLHQIDKEYIQIYEREKRMKNNNNNLLMIKNTAETQTQTEPQKDPKDLEREKFEKLQKDYDKLKENFSKCLKNLQTEKQMSETISKNYKILEDKNYNLSKEVEELSSSNRDLLMHFSVAENEKLQGEIEGGSIETKSSNSKGRRRKKK